MLRQNDRVGPWELQRFLGNDVLGPVWEARNIETGLRGALRSYYDFFDPNLPLVAPELNVRLRAAAPAPNLVSILDIGQEPQAYLVTELVEGHSLAQELHRRDDKRLPQPVVTSIAIGIANALDVLFQLGVVHGDINPSTVLLDSEGTPKLDDYFFATVAGFQGDLKLGQRTLSPGYVAPEVAAAAPATAASDIYAFGCTIFECLAGRPPFVGDVRRLAQLHETSAPDVELLGNCVPGLKTLITKCLQKEPSSRPASPVELLAALDEAESQLAQVSDQGRTPRTPTVVGPWVIEERLERWTFRCRHQDSGHMARVEVRFFEEMHEVETMRAEHRVREERGERLLGSNRLLLRPGEGWTNQPAGQFIFWSAFEVAPTQARLVLVTTSGASAWPLLPEHEYTIGRASDNSIVLNDPTVSRWHAVVREAESGWEILDLQSANGVVVDGTATEAAAIAVGSTIDVGGVRIVARGPAILAPLNATTKPSDRALPPRSTWPKSTVDSPEGRRRFIRDWFQPTSGRSGRDAPLETTAPLGPDYPRQARPPILGADFNARPDERLQRLLRDATGGSDRGLDHVAAPDRHEPDQFRCGACDSSQTSEFRFCPQCGTRSELSTGPSLIVDPATREVTVGPRMKVVSLALLEFALVELLARNQGMAVAKEDICGTLWGRFKDGAPMAGDNQMHQLVSRIKRKIEPEPSRPIFLVNVPGWGYKAGATVRLSTETRKKSTPSSTDLVSKDHRSFPGRNFSGWTCGAFCGSGGRGMVFEAHRADSAKAALKVYFPTEPSIEDASRFEDVFLFLQSARHPQLTESFAAGQRTDRTHVQHFILSEYIDGIDLSAWSRGRHGADPFARLKVARSLASTTLFIHEQRWLDAVGHRRTGLAHGDIKPENVLVRADGMPVLFDFWTPASTLGPTGDNFTGIAGTSGFVSPEQARSGLPTAQGDVYSLGETLKQLFRLTGFQRPTAEEQPAIRELCDSMTTANKDARRSLGDVVDVLDRLIASHHA